MHRFSHLTVQIARCAAGLLAAYAVSVLILIFFFLAILPVGQVILRVQWAFAALGIAVLITIGYCAVSVATFCTGRTAHHISCWAYTLIGSFLFIHHNTTLSVMSQAGDGSLSWTFILLSFLLAGGIAASVQFTARWYRTRAETEPG
jgi:hypothetical protein